MPPTLVLVDLQLDFFDVSANDIATREKAFCLPGARLLTAHARSRGWPILHVATEHTDVATLPRSLRDRESPKVYCIRGTAGADLVRGFWLEGDARVNKQGFSAFSNPQALALITRLQTVVLAGVAADCCVLATAFRAVDDLECEVVAPFQALSASDGDQYVSAMKILAKSAGIVCDLDALLAHDRDDGFLSLAMDQKTAGTAAKRWHAERSRVATPLAEYKRTIAQLGIDAALEGFELTLSGSNGSSQTTRK